MNLHLQRIGKGGVRKACAAFTLIEIMISLVILLTVLSGLVYGYWQANWTAEWCSMSLAAQSIASQGAEEARAADWRPRDYPVQFGYGTMDELTNGANLVLTNFMDIPTKGTLVGVMNYVSITNMSDNPHLRRIWSDAVWTFPMNGKLCTNTVILMRASDQ